MTPQEARDTIRKQDPNRALQADRVDPLPLPCTCPDEDKIEAPVLNKPRPIFVCGGRCR